MITICIIKKIKEINDLWNRVGLIAKLAKELQNSSVQFGKTAIMKYLFILQEVYGVQLGYDFSLYTYGPYCSDVISDLDYADFIKAIDMYSVGQGIGGYNINPTEKTGEYIKKAVIFLEENKRNIDELLRLFGDMTAKNLELRSTIIYIYKNYLKNKWRIDNMEIANDVQELKPYFPQEQILEAYQELKEKKIFEKLTV